MTRDHLYFGSIAVMLLAAAAFLYGLWGLAEQGLVMLWDTADGVVVDQATWSERYGGGAGRSGGHYTKYYLRVVYEYQVDGRTYTGWRIHHDMAEWHDGDGNPCQSFSLSGDRDEAAAGYRPGRAVTVHYSSVDPAESVLEVGLSRFQWAGLIGGLFFMAMGGYFFRSLRSNEGWAEREERKRGPDIRVR